MCKARVQLHGCSLQPLQSSVGVVCMRQWRGERGFCRDQRCTYEGSRYLCNRYMWPCRGRSCKASSWTSYWGQQLSRPCSSVPWGSGYCVLPLWCSFSGPHGNRFSITHEEWWLVIYLNFFRMEVRRR